MTSSTNPMTTADAKDLIERFQKERSEYFSAPIREIISEYEAWRVTTLEASPNSMTEAITDEMIEAGVAAWRDPSGFYDCSDAVREIYTAMQAARPIDQQEARKCRECLKNDTTAADGICPSCWEAIMSHSNSIAPVQDDDAELIAALRQCARLARMEPETNLLANAIMETVTNALANRLEKQSG